MIFHLSGRYFRVKCIHELQKAWEVDERLAKFSSWGLGGFSSEINCAIKTY
jgi:hypothetical protein